MSPRAGGVLALIAAVLLLVSLAVSWWSGAPTVDGHERHTQEVKIDLLKSEGCNVEGDETCQHVPLGGGFKTVEVIELIAAIATALATASLGLTALLLHPLRTRLAKPALIGAAVVAVGAIALLAISPDVVAKGHDVTVPIGAGAFLAIVGSLGAIGGAIIGRRAIVPRRAAAPQPMLPPQAPQAFDVQALLREDALRPSDLGPMHGRPPPSPGGTLPGPSGPLSPMNGQPAPLFSSAPQLRPLYEMPGAGFVPPAAPPLPTRAPTPVARSEFLATPLAGVDQRAETDWADQPASRPVVGSANVDAFGKTSVDTGQQRKQPPPPRRMPPPSPTRPPPAIPPRPPPPIAMPTPPPLDLPTPPLTPSPFEDERAPTDLPEDSFDSNVTNHPITDEVRVVGDVRPPTVDGRPVTDVVDEAVEGFAQDDSTAPGMMPDLPDPDDEAVTKGQPRISGSELERTNPVERPSISVIASTPPPQPTDKVPVVPAPEAEPEPADKPADKKLVMSTAPQDMPPPKQLDTPPPTAGPSPACPQCESPMAWVEEHLRFYCKSCKMYF